MGRLDEEARMTIKALSARGSTRSEIARLLGVTEGAVRYHAKRMASDVDIVLVTADKDRHISGMEWARSIDRRPRLIRRQDALRML